MRRLIVPIAASLVAACSPAPSEQEIAARKARDAAIVEASQEEERRKDRATHAAAAAEAAAKTEAMRQSDAAATNPSPERRTLTMVGKDRPVPLTEEEVIAQANARLAMALPDARSMLVRNPKLREQNTVVCLEVNSRDRTGNYTGYVPAIVTPRKVLVRKPIGEGRDVADVSATLEFDQLNDRLRCF